MWHTLWGLRREFPHPYAFVTWWEGSSFPGLVPPDDTVSSESVVGVKPGDCSVVIGYQIEAFTHNCSMDYFIA